MDTTNKSKSFKEMLDALKSVDAGHEVSDQLRRLGKELAALEGLLSRAEEARQDGLSQWSRQVTLLEELLAFQHNCLRFSSAKEAAEGIFGYLKALIPYQEGYLIISPDNQPQPQRILTTHPKQVASLKVMLENDKGLMNLQKVLEKCEGAEVFGGEENPLPEGVQWHFIQAGHILLFPIRIRHNLVGFGLLNSPTISLNQDHAAAINLILGSLASLLFQQIFFEKISDRFQQQSPFGKLLEPSGLPASLANGPMAILLLDENGEIKLANQGALKGLGAGEDSLLGKKLTEFADPKSAVILKDKLETEGLGESLPVLLTGKNQTIWEAYWERGLAGLPEGHQLVLAVDVTARKRLEQQQQEIVSMQQVMQFSRVMSGYLGDLLTVLTPNMSLLKTQLAESPELAKNIDVMELSLQQAEQVIKQLLNYGLPEMESAQAYDAVASFENVIAARREELPENVTMNFQKEGYFQELWGFPRRLERLLQVLVENAVEAMPEGGDLLLKVLSLPAPQAENGELIIEVADSGCGISEEIRPHIFKPFFSTKIKNEELGMGLFNAYSIVHDAGGQISIESAPDQGTRIRVTLPVSYAESLSVPEEKQGNPQEKSLPDLSLNQADDREEIVLQEMEPVLELPDATALEEQSELLPPPFEEMVEPEIHSTTPGEPEPLLSEMELPELPSTTPGEPEPLLSEMELPEIPSQSLLKNLKSGLSDTGINESARGILVVDDEFNIRNLLREILEHRGFTVYTAANGREGVEIFQEHGGEIGLVILDMVMPEMNGKDAFTQIKSQDENQKFLVISGYTKQSEVKDVLKSGASGYIKKPFQIDDLVERVNIILGEKGESD